MPPVDPSDEGLHEPGPEELWNESWYFDAVSDAGDLGIYARIGRLPNRDTCLYSACVTGPGRPSIMAVGEVPLPAADDPAQTVDGGGVRVEHHCDAPLVRFRVVLDAEAQAHADHAAPLRGEVGAPARIGFDLTWKTDGEPYRWRFGNRYEVPCLVAGRVTIDGGDAEFAGPGQRDHSWGARDWWAVDWMWTAARLDDGTRIHAVAIPGLPDRGVGYVQAGGELTEVTRAESREQISADGLVTGGELEGLFADDRQRARWLALLGAEPSDLAYEPLVDDILDRFADHLETHLDCDRLLALSAR